MKGLWAASLHLKAESRATTMVLCTSQGLRSHRGPQGTEEPQGGLQAAEPPTLPVPCSCPLSSSRLVMSMPSGPAALSSCPLHCQALGIYFLSCRPYPWHCMGIKAQPTPKTYHLHLQQDNIESAILTMNHDTMAGLTLTYGEA